MGGKGSKPLFITYEDAVKRLSDSELKRLRDAFKRHSSNGVITDKIFIKEVLGDGVPNTVAEFLFMACGGVPDKGIAWKELLCGLVLLTRGKSDEKVKFVFSLFSNDGTYIFQNEFQKTVEALENGYMPEAVSHLFFEHDRVSFEEFRDWLELSRDCISLTKWILKEPCTVSLGCDFDSPTFYQTLAGVTHLEEVDIVQLEKRYFVLKSHSVTGKLDEETLRPLISPPVPLSVCSGIFTAFDENRDSHIDFKEMACGISAATRGPLTERQKFCFKVFDSDHDGYLSPSEMKHMIQVMLFIKDGNNIQNDGSLIDSTINVEAAVIKELMSHATASDKGLTVEEYLMWTVDNPLPMHFLNLLFQVCHIVLGLRPVSKIEEGEIIRGWLDRENKRGFSVGQFWYLVSMDWWRNWLGHTSVSESIMTCNEFKFTGNDCSPSGSLKRAAQRLSKRSLQSTMVENTVALENSSVVVTGITPLELTVNSNVQRNHLSAPLSPCASPNQSPHAPRRNVHPGPIDNTSLITPSNYKVTTLTGEGGKLKKNVMLVRGRDFELVPDSLWKALWQWYSGSPPLPRQVIKPRNGDDFELELYPVSLRLLRHVQAQRTSPPPSSWSSMVGGYGAAAALSKYPLIGSTGYTYVSNLPSPPKRYLAHTATFSRMATVKQIYEFLSDRLHVRLDDMRLWHIKEEPCASMTLIEDETATLEEIEIQDDDQILIEIRNKDLTWPEEIGNLAIPQSDKCRTAGTTEKGVTGLNNLGNTCFMNAALQCVSNTKILTEYFLNDKHLYELNRFNSMGMKGHIAKRYGDLIHDIWSGTLKTVAPLKLRWMIGKYAPVFTGTQQHDSQELLAFLLDGLHEDLNRVIEKPYTKVKDSDGRPDVIVAQESWEATILRNKSIITDLFYGQLKSSITCSVCGYESAKFEAFNSLSLPLPLESFVHIQAIVLRLNGSVPVQYGLRLNIDATFGVLKNNLSSMIGIPGSLLKVVEVADGEIKVIHADDAKVKSQNQSSEPFYVYELPGDEERLSINSQRSQREAQTFTAIQRSIQPHLSAGGPVKVGGSGEEVPLFSNVSSDLESPLLEGVMMSSESEMSDGSERTGLPPSLIVAGQTDSGNCSASSSSLSDSTDAVLLHQPNYIIALHRKLLRQDTYFLSSTKIKPQLFGLPVLVPCSESTTHQDLYQSVWTQVARLVTPLPPSESTPPNHAMDCDDSLGYEFPFVLKAVNKEGSVCAWCPWNNFCRGCRIQCSDAEFAFGCCCLAIDWDATALHLRYQTALEKLIENHPSVMTTLAQQNEPINLDYCMEAFTKDELLTGDEKYNCPKCKEFQLATKKLQIFRLPPILIIHLKRFQFVNNRWIKSQKVVNVPLEEFDPTPYLAAVPKETILKHKRNLETGSIAETESESIAENESDAKCGREGEFQAKAGDSDENSEKMSGVLQDFHQHRLVDEKDPFDLRYKLYAVLSHHGFLGTGHYIAYALNPNGKWYFYNDSSIKETATPDTKAAYLLFYEREGLSKDNYMPKTVGPIQADIRDMDDELDDSELKKMCVVM